MENLRTRIKDFLDEEEALKHLQGRHNQKLHGNRGGTGAISGVREGVGGYRGIPKSTAYKLVRKSDNVIVAEGSAKDMRSMLKKNPGTFVGLTSQKIGERFGASGNLPEKAPAGTGLPGDYARSIAKKLDKYDFPPNSFGEVIKGHLGTMLNRVGFFNDDMKTYNNSLSKSETRPNLKGALAAKKNLEVSYNKLVSIVEERKDAQLISQLAKIDSMIRRSGGNERLVKNPDFGLWTEFDFGGDGFSFLSPE